MIHFHHPLILSYSRIMLCDSVGQWKGDGVTKVVNRTTSLPADTGTFHVFTAFPIYRLLPAEPEGELLSEISFFFFLV